MPGETILTSPDMKKQLSYIHINNVEDIRYRFLGDQNLYSRFVDNFRTPVNSDFYPYVDLNATKSRFMKEDIFDMLNIRLSDVPILDILYEKNG